MPDKSKPKRKKREVLPPFDQDAWVAVGAKPLSEYEPGPLLELFDRRPEGVLDDLGGDILEHLMVIVRERLEAFLPGGMHWQRRTDVEGTILDHLTRRNGPGSFRTHFISAIYKEVDKHNQELDRVEDRRGKALHGSVLNSWLRTTDDGDPHENADLKLKLCRLLDSIENEDHRKAVSMRLLEFEYGQIAEALGHMYSPRTIEDWVAKYLQPPPPLQRVWNGKRKRRKIAEAAEAAEGDTYR